MGILAAGRAMWIAVEAQFVKLARKRIIGHEAPDQRLANAEQQLDGFGSLQHADDPRQHAQHTGLGAAWRQFRRGWLRMEAAIAWSLVRLEDRQLPLEAEDAAMHNGLVGDDRGIVKQIARREIIGAIKNHVVVGDDARNVVFVEALDIGNNVDIGIEGLDSLAR